MKRRRQSLTDKRSYEAWELALAERDRALSEAARLKPYDGVMVGTKKLPGMFEVVITIYCRRKRKPITIVTCSDGRN